MRPGRLGPGDDQQPEPEKVTVRRVNPESTRGAVTTDVGDS